MSNDQFYQLVSVMIPFGVRHSPGKINRIFKSLGATLHYDVYGFNRLEKGPIWQSESYVYTTLFLEGIEVDAQEESDSVELQYPLATIGSEYIEKFAELVERVAAAFDSEALLDGKPTNKKSIISWCENLTSNLMDEWGEEPGSQTLRMLIESSY